MITVAAATRIALAALVVAAAGGCGGDERTFTAPEFVAEANRNGAPLELGAPLTVAGDDEVYGVAVMERGAGDRETAEEAGEHGGGSLRITEDAASAQDEHARCESAASLICYRAANVVLILEPGVPARDLARVAAAIRAMEAK
ncbi:MAG TPA: hypothetical protein VK920_09095 [Solirubrobacterales bacterium]|nr:hypothetical protein [Solirubrobacterales bacterium]